MQYFYKPVYDVNLLIGTSKIISMIDDDSINIDEMYESTKIYGQLLTAFGKPVYTTDDVEDQYLYIIEVTDSNNKKYIFSVYEGPSGPSIGGDNCIEGSEEAANSLRSYINSTKPSDYKYTGYYEGVCKVEKEIFNGEIKYKETPLFR